MMPVFLLVKIGMKKLWCASEKKDRIYLFIQYTVVCCFLDFIHV